MTLAGTFITMRDGSAVIKLDNGYNIGVDPALLARTAGAAATAPAPARVEQDPSLPPLSIISTGGTIASRIDYRTGAVTSQFSADDILKAIPRLGELARFRAVQLASILSENMTPALWSALALGIYEEIKSGAEGVIVTHGTDTMAYSAAAISFMLDTPVPVVFVGSQRSADRPSSDNVMNALCSAAVAKSDLAEVAVVMHAASSDERCAVHRATKVRKMHSSRRDAFRSTGADPVGMVDYPGLDVTLSPDARRRGRIDEPVLHEGLEERVGLLQFYPGMNPDIIRAFSDYRGLAIAGTGLGHVSGACIEAVKELTGAGTAVVMATQCLNGRVCDRVYDTGRDLLAAGVIEAEDMLPEVAMVKLMWVLARAGDDEELQRLMTTDLKGEIGGCSAYGLF